MPQARPVNEIMEAAAEIERIAAFGFQSYPRDGKFRMWQVLDKISQALRWASGEDNDFAQALKRVGEEQAR